MGGNNSLLRSKGSIDASKPAEQTTEKKKGIVDWMNLIKPGNEEKDHWVILKPFLVYWSFVCEHVYLRFYVLTI